MPAAAQAVRAEQAGAGAGAARPPGDRHVPRGARLRQPPARRRRLARAPPPHAPQPAARQFIHTISLITQLLNHYTDTRQLHIYSMITHFSSIYTRTRHLNTYSFSFSYYTLVIDV